MLFLNEMYFYGNKDKSCANKIFLDLEKCLAELLDEQNKVGCGCDSTFIPA